MTNYSIEQVRFFNKLQDELGLNKLSNWLSDLLEIDASNAYRRISGEKELSFSEYLKICREVPIASSWFAPGKKTSRSITSCLHHFSNWQELRDYYQTLIKQFLIAKKSQHTLYYSGSDLPIFFYHFDEILLRYKISMWVKYGGLKMQGPVPDDIIQLGTCLFQVYKELNTEEIWYAQGVINQLEQLKYSAEMDDFDIGYQRVLLASYRSVINWFEERLAKGRKEEGTLKMYLSDFHIMNDGGLLRVEGYETLMNRFQGIYFLRSEESHLIKIFKQHWQAHTGISQLLSAQNEKRRYSFFKTVKTKLNQLEPEG